MNMQTELINTTREPVVLGDPRAGEAELPDCIAPKGTSFTQIVVTVTICGRL